MDFPIVNFIKTVWLVERMLADCWQVPFSKMAMLKVKEDMVTDCKLIFIECV